MEKEITKEKAKEEVEKFHIHLLKNIIKVIKLNQKEVRKLEQDAFNRGSIAFGNVLIHQINKEIKKMQKEGKK